jgi:hypothetical protein
MVSKFLACLVLEKNKSEIFAGFFENTSNSKSCSESRNKSRNNFQNRRRVSELPTLKGTGGYQKAGTSSLKRVTGSDFIDQGETSYWISFMLSFSA